MWDTEVYPGERAALRSRQAARRIERIQAILAVERAAFDAGWGALTRYGPDTYDARYCGLQRSGAGANQAGPGFNAAVLVELGGIRHEVRELRRELGLRSAGAAQPLRALPRHQFESMPPPAAYSGKDFVGMPLQVHAGEVLDAYHSVGAGVSVGRAFDRPL
jgi:hypothetical protein